MKRPNILIALAALAAFTPLVRADDHSPAAAAMNLPVEQRLMRIDLDVAVRHYEKLQDALRNSRLEMLVNDGSLGENHPQMDKLQRKMEILSKLTEETRREILDLGHELEKSTAMAAQGAGPGAGMMPGFGMPGSPGGGVPGMAAPMGLAPGTMAEPGVLWGNGVPLQFVPSAGVPGAPGAMTGIPGAVTGAGAPTGAMIGNAPTGVPMALPPGRAAMPVPGLTPVPPPIATPPVAQPVPGIAPVAPRPPVVEPPPIEAKPDAPLPPVAQPPVEPAR